ncbi:hypothetical protein [Metabacillus fastidiosus]|uniref:hypothetical protein n=1 Tax=Metabacillus fastidiosus TaxID=1458 RepID=UPI003D2CF852
MTNKIISNVQALLDKYKSKLNDDEKKLVLLYWQQFDGVEMDKQSISTTDFLNKATSSTDIVNAAEMIKLMKES